MQVRVHACMCVCTSMYSAVAESNNFCFIFLEWVDYTLHFIEQIAYTLAL
jgi:hypothetical protein